MVYIQGGNPGPSCRAGVSENEKLMSQRYAFVPSLPLRLPPPPPPAAAGAGAPAPPSPSFVVLFTVWSFRYSASMALCRSKSSWRSFFWRICSMSRMTPSCIALRAVSTVLNSTLACFFFNYRPPGKVAEVTAPRRCELTDLSAFCWKWTMPTVERANSDVAARVILEARDIVAGIPGVKRGCSLCVSKQGISGDLRPLIVRRPSWCFMGESAFSGGSCTSWKYMAWVPGRRLGLGHIPASCISAPPSYTKLGWWVGSTLFPCCTWGDYLIRPRTGKLVNTKTRTDRQRPDATAASIAHRYVLLEITSIRARRTGLSLIRSSNPAKTASTMASPLPRVDTPSAGPAC